MAGLAAAFGSGAMTNSVPELQDADCILVTGSNTTENHPLISARLLRAGRLIVVDPRRVHLARLAHIHARPRPGTDVVWISGLIHVILAQGWEDEEFIARHTEGFDALRESVVGYGPERVEELTGIPRDQLYEIAEAYATAERAAIVYAMGITQHATGTDNVLALANLALVTGNVGKRSTGVNPLRGQNNVQGACDMGNLPDVFPGYQKVADADARRKFEEAWQVKLPAEPGLTLVEMMNAAAEGALDALYVMGENPVVSDPDAEHVRRALERLPFLVVQDIFLTETAALADVVLPGHTFAERDGTVTSTDRSVQRVRRALAPPGDAWPDGRILCEVARRCGGTGFDYESPADVFAEMARLTPIYGGMSWERLEQEWLRWPCRTPTDPGTEFLYADGFPRGRARFTPVEHREPVELPDPEFPFLLTTGRLMFQYHTGTLTRRSPSLDREAREAYVELHPADARDLDVADGQPVRLASRRGAIQVTARVTRTVDKGVVFVPFHFAEAAANVLTHRTLDPVAKIPEYKVCAVSVERCA